MHELYFGESAKEERAEIQGQVLDSLTDILTKEGYLKKKYGFQRRIQRIHWQ
jgi:translation initiation factor 1 (eIF-1/SUI1)